MQNFTRNMYNNKEYRIERNNIEYKVIVDENGHLVFPPEIAERLGLIEGVELKTTINRDRIEIYSSIHNLSKVYIEPTARCNLSCRTCIRRTWKEPMDDMELSVFDALVEQLKDVKTLQTVMFGGFGEPSSHKDIHYMIGRIKSLGVNIEMVTNGTLLNEPMLKGLMENGLDTVWVSFDGTSENTFEDVRVGAGFKAVVENLKCLKMLNKESDHKLNVGIAFVVMKKNAEDLKYLDVLASKVGASKISISNLLPYSKEMVDQMMCDVSAMESDSPYYYSSIHINLPLLDRKTDIKNPLYDLVRTHRDTSILNSDVAGETNKCPFIRDRATFIRWDGMVSPCMGLLHSHKTFLNTVPFEREITSYTLGNILEEPLKNIWESKEYHDFREKVRAFIFSPCLKCGGSCDLAEKNHEDCFGNEFPTCGGCMWAQGLIQCP